MSTTSRARADMPVRMPEKVVPKAMTRTRSPRFNTRGPGGWELDEAGGVGAGTQGFDLSIWDAGRDIAEADDAEDAETGVDRQPSAVADQREQIAAKERLNRFPRLDARQKYLKTARLEMFGREGLTRRLDTSAGPIWFRHGCGRHSLSPDLARPPLSRAPEKVFLSRGRAIAVEDR
jgi:hypothetical protein